MGLPRTPEQPESLDTRLAYLEQLVRNQQTQIAQQAAELAALRGAPAAATAEPRTERAASGAPARAGGGSRRSRRALLKLGGAAAAAGVAAAAAGAASEMARPGVAHATSNPWTTSAFTADAQTYVSPLNSSYADPTMLSIKLGTGSPYLPLTNPNSAAIAAYDTMATATNGGVAGTSIKGIGIAGLSQDNIGIFGGSANGYGAEVGGGLAPLKLLTHGSPGAPTTGAHTIGELYTDSAGGLWYCTANGTPGTWIRLSGPQSGVPGGALNYLAAPIRIYDTRPLGGAPLPTTKAPLAGQSMTTIQVTGTDVGGIHVPAGATGVFGNLTVTNTQGGGDLILWPHGATQPTTSNINYGPGQTVANSANVGLSSGGAMDLFVHVSGTDVIFDVAGYVL